MDRIHIFIPVYYREATVRKSLEAVLATYKSVGYDVRIILVDNKSNDSLRKHLKSLEAKHHDVITKLLDRNMGKGPAINWAAEQHPKFQWFINCDSDIVPTTKGWPGILAECYSQIPAAGMVSVEYELNGNNPMPNQPQQMVVKANDGEHTFNWGGQVAGGCFITEASVWKSIRYRCSGVYGGVDGVFRQNVAQSLNRKCGFVSGVMAQHLDDRTDNKGYHEWKMEVQRKIRAKSPLADAADLGNDKGYWD